MNITLSIDEKMAEEARKVARSMGKSLNQMIRDYLKQMTRQSDDDIEKSIQEFHHLCDISNGNSKGWKFNREELYDEVLHERMKTFYDRP